VIAEDLARICRRQRAYDFCETCLDRQTRLIAINDRIDTSVEGWQDSAFISTWHHERSNRDTSQRIRRSLRHRFTQGGVFQFVLFGYIKKPGGTTEADVSKDPKAEGIYEEWFRKLEGGASYSEISDWLNEQGIPPGPMSRGPKWTGAMVARVTHNPMLKGVRVRNDKIARRINKTGRHVSVKAPTSERLERICPHLAFIETERYDRVIAMLKAKNNHYKRKRVNGVDPRKNISKKRTMWPGQHLRCGICNRIYYWYGLGKKKLMKCSGNQNYRCWNGVEIDGKLAATKLAEAIFQEISSLPEFDATLLQKARQQWQKVHGSLDAKRKELERRKAEVTRKIGNITEAIAGGHVRSLVEKLEDLEKQSVSLTMELQQIASALPPKPELPSLDVIKRKAKEVFAAFGPEVPDVGRLMKILIPSLKVFPVRLCDGGRIQLRARVWFNLAALTEPFGVGITSAFCREITVDLFDPPQREKYRRQIVSMRAEGMTEKTIAARLALTITAVQRATALQRRMDELGLTDPYVPVSEAQIGEVRFRRHLHPRYKFEPLEDNSSAG
jgi:DNA invertase Pin-like site-specific DNA recombinase